MTEDIKAVIARVRDARAERHAPSGLARQPPRPHRGFAYRDGLGRARALLTPEKTDE